MAGAVNVGKKERETSNSINKSFSSNVVPGRFLMDEIKHFHLHLPPDRALINPSSWSAELRHQTDTARAEEAADTSPSLSLSPLAFTATTTIASPETCTHLKLPIFGALPFGSKRTLTLGLGEADLLLSSAEVAFRLCRTDRAQLKQRSFLVFPPAQVTFSPAGPTLLLCGG